jgi:non-ribosomal peptide synthetase component F/thioesterase domain-containing protein/acyl carrier protein
MSENTAPAATEFERVECMADDERPLDWKGPTDRSFILFRDEYLDRSILDSFERVARRHPDRVAVTDSETSLSYVELWDGVCGLAETIAAQTRQGDLIGILLPTCSMGPLAMLACLAAGRPFVALDPHYPSRWLGQVLEDARPALIIAGELALAGVETGLPAVRIIHLTRPPQAAREGWRPTDLAADEPACVLFTSGSTGRPKGIVNSQRNLLQRAAQCINAAHVNQEDKFLTLASLCTIVGVRDVMIALLAGASVRLLDPQRVGVREILNVIRTEAITVLFAFPALLRSVVGPGGEQAGGALRLVRVGGDTTLWSDIDLLRAWLPPEAAIQVIYAATEAPMMQWFVDDSCRRGDARVPIGYPLPGNRLAVVDEYGRATPPGEVGELIVRSPYVALGRWVQGRSVPESIESHGARLFQTGDLVRRRPDGLLERIGRKNRQVKIRGSRVDLDGVEAALRQHPFVRDVGALARTAGADGAVTLVAYVSAHHGAPDGLIADLEAQMRSAPPPMRPGRIYLTDRIPRLPSSKLDLRALMILDETNVEKEHATVAAMDRAGSADGDWVEQTVAQVWQEMLHAPVGGPQDDFFEVGGDSLKAITFMMELERALGLELSVTLINEAPTFGGLCRALREHGTTRYTPLVLLKAGEGLPPVFIVHGVGGNVAELFPMARCMAYPGAVVGVQARGLADRESPHVSVEAMAADYLKEIKVRQPHGPYHLCGYSFGGLVAFEMARRMSESGDEIRLVGLFDTMMSPLRWPPRAWFSIVRRQMVQFARGIRAAPVQSWPEAVYRAGGRFWDRVRGRALPMRLDDPPLPSFLQSAPARVLKVAASALIASARYRPGYYCGELTLFTPTGREPGLPSLQSIWRKHARGLTVVETTGAHATMLSPPNAESTAASLTRRLSSR